MATSPRSTAPSEPGFSEFDHDDRRDGFNPETWLSHVSELLGPRYPGHRQTIEDREKSFLPEPDQHLAKV